MTVLWQACGIIVGSGLVPHRWPLLLTQLTLSSSKCWQCRYRRLHLQLYSNITGKDVYSLRFPYDCLQDFGGGRSSFSSGLYRVCIIIEPDIIALNIL